MYLREAPPLVMVRVPFLSVGVLPQPALCATPPSVPDPPELPPEAELVVPPEAELVAPPDPDRPPEAELVVPPEAELVVPPEAELVVPPEAEPVVPPEPERPALPEAELVVPPDAELVVPPDATLVVPPDARLLVPPEADPPVDRALPPEPGTPPDVALDDEPELAPPVELELELALDPDEPPVPGAVLCELLPLEPHPQRIKTAAATVREACVRMGTSVLFVSTQTQSETCWRMAIKRPGAICAARRHLGCPSRPARSTGSQAAGVGETPEPLAGWPPIRPWPLPVNAMRHRSEDCLPSIFWCTFARVSHLPLPTRFYGTFPLLR
jgi:hypothetical protein